MNVHADMYKSELQAQLIPNPYLMDSCIKWGSKPKPLPINKLINQPQTNETSV